MTDPMITLVASDSPVDFLTEQNENNRRRFTSDERVVADAAATQLATDETLVVSAVTASRTLALLPAATANALYVVITSASPTFTYTLNPDAAELIDGAATKVYTSAQRLLLMPNGTSWRIYDLAGGSGSTSTSSSTLTGAALGSVLAATLYYPTP